MSKQEIDPKEVFEEDFDDLIIEDDDFFLDEDFEWDEDDSDISIDDIFVPENAEWIA